ncbi:hypothetical protein NMY22_g5482 [Coprinellus aureogranulatus]|nr:hypothetical protein NMY22_g5482 [Coprinellus aureogranulatus]
MYGHVAKSQSPQPFDPSDPRADIPTVAEEEKAGIEEAGGSAVILQVPETLPADVLAKMNAPAKPAYPIATVGTLEEYNAFLFGIPTRYGNFPAQPSGTPQVDSGKGGSSPETTALNSMSTLVHHGIIFVPFGYSHAFDLQANISEVHGGSAWGAGTLAGPRGLRQPSDLELKCAKSQGAAFWNTAAQLNPTLYASSFVKSCLNVGYRSSHAPARLKLDFLRRCTIEARTA